MFEQLCRFVASSYGRPDTKFAVWQGAIDTFSQEQVTETARKDILDKVIDALTKQNPGAHQDD